MIQIYFKSKANLTMEKIKMKKAIIFYKLIPRPRLSLMGKKL
jgi:hypothetical protein